MRILYFEPQPLKYMCEDPSDPRYKDLETEGPKRLYKIDPGEIPSRTREVEIVDLENPDEIYSAEKG